MPELPEVETIVRDLKPLCRKTFSDVIVHDTFLLRQPKEDLIRRVKGQSIRSITRRGKAIVVALSSGEFLVVQLMMTGQLIMDSRVRGNDKNIADRHRRLTFRFTDGTGLFYNDQRRFGQLRVVSALADIKYFNILGHEPFSADFTPAYIKEALCGSGRPIKNTLLDHTFVAGIGNIYACEMLFQSRISPKRPGRRLSTAEIAVMHRVIIEVLKEAITHRGSSMRNYRDASGQKGKFNERLSVYGREGLRCPRCGAAIKRIIQAGRSTFYCGKCQK
jgi:formamidopyrimidine-DNA glycosylase